MSMTWTVVVPFSSEDSYRCRALAHVLHALESQHLDAVWGGGVWFGDTWSKGNAVDDLVRGTYTEGIIVHDADVLVSEDALRRSMLAVEAGVPWSQPHGTVYRLSRGSTLTLYAHGLGEVRPMFQRALAHPAHPAPPAGGCVVLSRAAYEVSGGIDPRFDGFGGDDISWARALDTLVGPGVLLDAPMWHLFHPRTFRRPGNRGSPENEALAARYGDAAGDMVAMRHIVNEHRVRR
jgi:hypothetical protein